MNAAGKQASQYLRNGLPQSWKALAGSKASKGKGSLGAFSVVGMTRYVRSSQFKSGKVEAKSSKDLNWKWFLAYWHNYGTLANRDPGHQFAKAVKSRPVVSHRVSSKGRSYTVTRKAPSEWKGGNQAQHFYDSLESGMIEKYTDALEREFKKNVEDIKMGR